MQRLATHGARVATPVGIGVGVAIASGANTSTAHCRAPQVRLMVLLSDYITQRLPRPETSSSPFTQERERELQPTSPKRTLSLSDGVRSALTRPLYAYLFPPRPRR
jgi:hypothetical protein